MFFAVFDITERMKNDTEIRTEKGVLYLPKSQANPINTAIKYIQSYTFVGQKILVLPEGTAINFLTDRNPDGKMPMADRLYYEAIGEEVVMKNVAEADYEMIFIAEGFGLTHFGAKYLYDDKNPVLKYIQSKYNLDWVVKDGDNIINCYVKPY